MKKNIKILLLVLWMGFIFFLSSKPDSFYPENSFNFGFLAHIFLYLVLAFLMASMLFDFKKFNLLHVLFFALVFSILYGITDEYHQSFVLGREPSGVDLILDSIGAVIGLGFFYLKNRKPKMLLHICCIGCGAQIIKDLRKQYNLKLYFYNPNIFPKEEYDLRKNEAIKVAKKFFVKLVSKEGSHKEWLGAMRGHELDPERGERCALCYKERMESAAVYAKNNGFDFFATTLTISPHKDAEVISEIGRKLAAKYNINYFDRDFKKDGGFQKTCELSKKLGLYRQSYCGCEFSIRKK